jgi:hypothetical protein
MVIQRKNIGLLSRRLDGIGFSESGASAWSMCWFGGDWDTASGSTLVGRGTPFLVGDKEVKARVSGQVRRVIVELQSVNGASGRTIAR